MSDPSFDMRSVDLVTDRNNIRKLLSFVNPGLSRGGLEPFTIDVEVLDNSNNNKTAVFCRAETETFRAIEPHEFRGFGHEFEKTYTTDQVEGSTGHHRIISYRFSDLNLIVRYETDGYVDSYSPSSSKAQTESTKPGNANNLSSKMESLSLHPSSKRIPRASTSSFKSSSKLSIKEKGHTIPIDSTLEVKTRVIHKPIDIQEVLPQLWVSQTPNLVRAYHRNGMFECPEVENVMLEIKRWEENHREDLRRLAALIRRIINVVRESGENAAVVKYDGQGDRLVIWKADGRKMMLPDDLYSKLG